jgi:hypothetical protein
LFDCVGLLDAIDEDDEGEGDPSAEVKRAWEAYQAAKEKSAKKLKKHGNIRCSLLC